MKCLPESIRSEFEQFWVFLKTQKKFATMPIDQAHEHNNAKVKASGGAIGLTENPVALKRWMVSGPEQTRLLYEFERQCKTESTVNFQHHEHGFSAQHAYKNQVNKLCTTISTMGNPFTEESKDLMKLDSHDCVHKSAIETLYGIEALGKSQYMSYVQEVLIDRTVSIHNPITETVFRSSSSLILPLKPRQNSKCKT